MTIDSQPSATETIRIAPIHTRRTPQQRAVDPKTGRLFRIVRETRSANRSFATLPISLRRARLDNLAIVPASLLPYEAEWQALANSLPAGSTVIVLPPKPGTVRTVLERICSQLSAQGTRVTTIQHGEHDAWEVGPL